MKWLILFAVLFTALVLFLLNSAPVDTDPLSSPAPGNVASKDDIRQCARDLLLVERAREWLLEDSE